jgi:hypothetical protein
MDIFNSNRRLEELTMFGIDWGIYLRHNIEGPIAPFMFLQNGKEQYIRMLMTDGDPMEFARSILVKEEKPFEQFIIGFEGYLRDDKNNRVDSIIVHGYDITQEKGVILGQMFNPKESGGFRKIDKTTYLGKPELILEKKSNPNADYTVEELDFNAMAISDNNLTWYIAFFLHKNPSVIANSIKRFLRSKLGGEKRLELTGKFMLNISEEEGINQDFLKFLVTSTIDEELASQTINEWINQTGRTINISCKLGEELIYESSKANTMQTENFNTDYSNLSNAEMDIEFSRIISIPNARTNITALTQMSALMEEYKKRGIQLPSERKKKWWKFW